MRCPPVVVSGERRQQGLLFAIPGKGIPLLQDYPEKGKLLLHYSAVAVENE